VIAIPQIAENFQTVLHEHTAGSPVEPDLIWTNLTATDIAQRVSERGTPVSVHIVEQLLEENDYHRRKAQKDLPMKSHEDRDVQFQTIAQLKQQYLSSGDPILSIDTKKRELIGNFYRPGVLLTRETRLTFDHDFPSFAEGVVIPHGLYDPRLNRGYVHLGTSRETSEFACDCLKDWWLRFGRVQYPKAKSLLLQCDGGGSNSASTHLFKADLQTLVDELGLEIRVAHYPPYCSKYNPIEHRLFCHLSRACQGMIFTSVGLVKQLMEGARTRTGLRVVVDVVEKTYQIGRKVAEEVKQTLNIVRDIILPKLNYRILPRT
jgi:Rhodopirellula transposase DDE domain